MTSQLIDQEKISTSENIHYSSIRPWQWMALGSGSTILLFLSGFGAWTLASQLLLNSKVFVQNQLSFATAHASVSALPDQELGLDLSNISRQKISSDTPLNSRYLPMKNGATGNGETLIAVGDFQEGVIIATKTPDEVQKPSPNRAVESNKPTTINPATPENDPKRESAASGNNSNPPTTTLASDSGTTDDSTTKKSPYSSRDYSNTSFDNISFDWGWGFSEGLAEVQVGERWGYIDRMGRMVIKPRFQEARYFSEGLASIKSGDRWGYIDRTGKIVISPRFQEAKEFSESFAAVKFDGKWGYIDNVGSFVVQPQYEAAETFHEGLANVKSDDLWGYIDPTGRVKISLQFTDTWGFSQGIAQVKLGKRIAYIDKDGNFISTRP